MSVKWNVVQRQVILRSNQLAANSASALATAYAVTTIGDTEMADRAIEFPAGAINDAILNAAGVMVQMIGQDIGSPYRNFFAGVTNNIATGAVIPIVSSTSKPRIGVIGDVRDSSTGISLKMLPKTNIENINGMTLKQLPYYFFTDNVRIWHTRPNVIADIVMFSITDELTNLTSSPRGDCPFPDDLIAPLVEGSLCYVFRAEWNAEQAQLYYNRWAVKLQAAGVKTDAETLQRMVSD